MLVLTRKIGEAIVIQTREGEVRLTVLSIGEKKVRIGAEAPRSIQVDREEVVRRIPGRRPVVDVRHDDPDDLIESDGPY